MPGHRYASLKPLILACALSCNASAQSPVTPAPVEPSSPHERLRFFEGAWTTTDSTPEDGFRETCSWLPQGRRHMVCISRWKTESGPREGMSVFSFDTKASRYVYTGFRPGGALVVHHGEERDGRWLFASEEGAGPARVRTRVIIEANMDRGFKLSSERSIGDGPWSQTSQVTYRRVEE